jgi:acyl-coenzyme A thioesterase PaaI-like protein
MESGDSFIADLGLRTAADGDVVRGRAGMTAEMCVPGTDVVRTSVLATWADVITGLVAGQAVSRRIPLTLDLEVQLQGRARAGAVVESEAIVLKAGRTVVVCEARFRDAAGGTPYATAVVSFVPSPDPADVWPGDGLPLPIGMSDGRLSAPLADRVGCRVVEPGVAEVPHRLDGLNASGAIQGGLVALAAEEAISSLAAGPVVAYAINVRYLRPFRVGPARAVATGDEEFALVHLTDLGTGKLGAVATARTSRVAPV